MNSQQRIIASARRWHHLLLWPALLAVFVFVISAFMHLLLTWTGPQAARNQAPRQVFGSTALQAIPRVLAKHRITRAELVKLVPSASGALLQVTVDRSAPRRYFDLHSGDELPGHDEQQARWLASYYLDDSSRVIEAVEFQTAFDNDYPWVNRLLPVYKVRYAGEDGLTLYLHTESLALAGISNGWKHQLQRGFRQLHTFAWLESIRHGRILLMLLLLSCLLAMAMAGMALLYGLKRKQGQRVERRTHRILAHVLGIPLLGFTASGIYHLLHSEYAPAQRDFNLALPLKLDQLALVSSVLPTQPLHSVSLIAAGGRLFYRASIAKAAPPPAAEHDHHNGRQLRFDGIPAEQGAIYIPMDGAAAVAMTDEQVAWLLARDHVDSSNDEIVSVEKMTRFGPEYDFRNKRLPVWRIEINSAARDILFVDVNSGLLVDRVSDASRLEGYSFSLLHKWNFLTQPLGRGKRDALIAAVLCGILLLAIWGLRIKVAGRR